jgi:2-oxoglutarate dehydrogenase E2 component (dihydrolipoamide succinyltransferase)
MSVNIVVPGFGESITEGTIAQWLKKEGEYVNKDDILLEVESEKATQGIPSPAAGVLHIQAREGDRVEVGGVIGSIDESAAKPAGERSEPAGSERPTPPKPKPREEPVKPAASRRTERALSPTARRAARAAQEDRVAVKLVPAAEPNHPSLARPANDERRVPMSAIRQRIAERLLTSQKTTASLTTFNEVDLSAVMELRARYKDVFKEKHGVGLGFLSFFVKAAIEALKAYPLANAAIDGRDVVYHDAHHIGVAVSTDKGLMVPVLRGADRLSFADIEKAIADLAVKARDGKISVADLQGGTFTITNGGIFGSMLSTPILNFPQSAILGMHAIQKRPVVRDDQIVIRPMMYVALTYDHRLLDGREAVLFLVRVKECIEDPQRLLLEI